MVHFPPQINSGEQNLFLWFYIFKMFVLISFRLKCCIELDKKVHVKGCENNKHEPKGSDVSNLSSLLFNSM